MGKNFALTLFIIITLGLAGYICYDKMVAKNDTCIKNINKDQALKVNYYVSDYGETAYQEGRVSLVLMEQDANRGYYSLGAAYSREAGGITGPYELRDGKLVLIVNEAINTGKAFTLYLGADLEKTETEGYSSYTLDYNESELQIGKVKLYAVNK